MVWQLFASFFRIGLFTFGGGYEMIPLIEREIIERRRWVAREEFLELLALAQSAPGPIALNTAVFVGYRSGGNAGAVAAVMGVVVPSFVVILCVAMLFADVRHNSVVDAAFRAMRPAVVALIVAPMVGLAKGLRWWGAAIAAAVALLVWQTGMSPVWLLLAAAVTGVVWALCQARKGVRR